MCSNLEFCGTSKAEKPQKYYKLLTGMEKDEIENIKSIALEPQQR